MVNKDGIEAIYEGKIQKKFLKLLKKQRCTVI